MKTSLAVLAIVAAGLLAACGGDSDDGATETTDPGVPASPSGNVPPSATASIAAFVEYIGWLASAERDAPLLVNDVVPPTSETALPSPVN